MTSISPHRRAYGQFFTPEPVVAACYDLLAGALPESPRIADPACGDGAFLRYAATRAISAPARIAGCDVDAQHEAHLARQRRPAIPARGDAERWVAGHQVERLSLIHI